MKLLFDENLSPDLVESLSDLFPDSKHVHICGLGGADDSEIWTYAKTHDFLFLSKDADFADMAVRDANPPKFVWVRIGNKSAIETEDLLRRNAILIQYFWEQERETLLVLRWK